MSPALAPARTPARFTAGPAPSPRTLLDVLAATVDRHPNEPAVDAGGAVLTYRALSHRVDALRGRLAAAGIGTGDRVGVRISSGTAELYVAILAVLAVGAAYVPVDAEDPAERADLVFGEAAVCAVLTDDGLTPAAPPSGHPGRPGPGDDAWVIFTSGSTGTPKGVAVGHRAAAAFVDAEARLFLRDEPLGPGDRVLAGLSVAFDASCEEMWLAWRHGACLVPAPRALVRTGVDLGPWLRAQRITVVSTVPTLAALWPADALEDVRLLIFGGEACPPELAARVAVEGREVWNTYGPTEATVVACAAPLTGEGPVRIGLPLDGWELAVVDAAGGPVPMGGTGELVIGGVGLARYLDAARDAEKFAPAPALGWDRAYRSGDVVRAEPDGLLFLGRADEQVKLGGRRIELGEVDAALAALPGVRGAAAAVRRTRAGNQVLVGYVAADDLDHEAATALLRERLPAALVPLLAVVDDLPTRTSGKVDRDALPWPLTGGRATALTPTQAWLAQGWEEILGAAATDPSADFFALGGGSLTAAQLVALIRTRHPQVAVDDLYRHPRLADLAAHVDALPGGAATDRAVAPVPRRTGFLQALLMVPVLGLVGLRWTAVAAAVSTVAGWAVSVPWWTLALAWLVLFSPPGRIAIAAGGARLLLRGVRPGTHPRGGSVHLRIWAAERLAELSGATGVAGASWTLRHARLLGAKVGADVHLHAPPPVTGMLKLGRGASVEPEVDLAGHWVDGDVVHVGRIRIGAGARVGSRSTLLPGTRIGKGAEVVAGSTVAGPVPAGRRWAGSPAARTGRSRLEWPAEPAPRSRFWTGVYGATSAALGLLPAVAALPGLALLVVTRSLLAVPAATLAYLLTYALLVLLAVRVLGAGTTAGYHPVHGRVGWRVWTTERLMGMARTGLFPLYASSLTPTWLRALGATVGRDVEISTVIAQPRMTTIGDGAFLADDTMVGTYELRGGWLHVAPSRIGERAFLGNSGMTAPGRSVPDRGLVGVLSATPRKAKKGSSWLGLPPMPLQRSASDAGTARTFHPPRRLRVARALVEVCRVVPVMVSATLAVLVLGAVLAVWTAAGPLAAAALAGPFLLVAGLLAAGTATAAKWVLVGRFRAVEHPLWSAFVWRDELADTFVEVLAVPWLVGPATGTPVLGAWLRTMGARIGRGAWLETYWLPESDLVTIGRGATVNRGCVVQTHLFHDRIMSMSPVHLDDGATLGPHGIVLPGAGIGAGTTVGPGSLVTRGDAVPAGTRWRGNPIRSW
ncbi:Pls/PosA family non-ribosomal peptide synthetase [Pseudonocardia hydrocarbonoxydans]|uniref:Amino acid adenylation protein n=1 Tax=Pseudonocardia hydrocarbonoxydans TaxID=76726 RepID=A0A4Y3WL55_9PSEU|nr:Pls/PosA family non-ribosomal peptide synthetase [Pseudonocardia hydrocarbonoxydans]GEC19514.1 amino acid adenylation protein [Pseudonocardia hydrocarbonoxydans]